LSYMSCQQRGTTAGFFRRLKRLGLLPDFRNSVRRQPISTPSRKRMAGRANQAAVRSQTPHP
jgi:hypothetical protein